jgi:hypothetical protein
MLIHVRCSVFLPSGLFLDMNVPVDVSICIASTSMLMASVRQGRDDLVRRVLTKAGLPQFVTSVEADIATAPVGVNMRDTLTNWLLREGDALIQYKSSGINQPRMEKFRAQGKIPHPP